VQIFVLFPEAKTAQWRFGCRLFFPTGLNLVARVRFEYPPPTIDPFSHRGHIFAIALMAR